MKKRRLPRSEETPLTKRERIQLCIILDSLEWEAYRPYKHNSGGYADAEVYQIDDFKIKVELTSGIDGQGDSVKYTEDITIERENLFALSV
jgi:hypothetical protein